jgi:hypothetical protein
VHRLRYPANFVSRYAAPGPKAATRSGSAPENMPRFAWSSEELPLRHWPISRQPGSDKQRATVLAGREAIFLGFFPARVGPLTRLGHPSDVFTAIWEADFSPTNKQPVKDALYLVGHMTDKADERGNSEKLCPPGRCFEPFGMEGRLVQSHEATPTTV